MIAWAKAGLSRLASLWFTLACLVLLALLLVASRLFDTAAGPLVAGPFMLLGLNLLAALAVTPRLRRQAGLLVFHLSLAALALLAGVGQLTTLHGHVEVTEGAAFEDSLVNASAGPLHPWQLDRVTFVQGPFDINYLAGMRRRETVSTVLVPGGDGSLRPVRVGDDKPLVVNGYRFYTTFNKGFAPVLSYVDGHGQRMQGAVHLPSYPLNDFKQGNTWHLPDGSRSLKLWLSLPEPVYKEDAAWRFTTPEQATLVVVDGERRHGLLPGESFALDGGELRYEELRTWMGYTISYDPTTPWLVATAAVGALAFAWHVVGRAWRRPWHADEAEVGNA